MHASVGDKIVVKGHHVGEAEREAVVLAVEGDDGGPPYRVRWTADDREGIYFPGSDVEIEHPST